MIKYKNINDINHTNVSGKNLDIKHPGYFDITYRMRRKYLCDIADNYKIGDKIPKIYYNDQEKLLWNKVLKKTKKYYPTYACKEFNDEFNLLNYDEYEIPQLQEISDKLYEKNRWRIRPVAGLLKPRDFLAGLSFKYFHSTQFLRHKDSIYFTKEPDIIHELIGHIPLLFNRDYADLVQQIGKISLKVDDKELKNLIKIYWYLIEYGVIREKNDEKKILGAGILSSYSEILNFTENKSKILSFHPKNKFENINYMNGCQKNYYIIDSIEDAELMIQEYSKSVEKRYII